MIITKGFYTDNQIMRVLDWEIQWFRITSQMHYWLATKGSQKF